MTINSPDTRQAETRPAAAWHGYAWSICGVAIAWGVSLAFRGWLDPVNLIMPFLLAVVATAYWQSRGPAVLSALAGVAAFDFFLVPPYLSFAVADAQYLITLGAMLATGLAITELAAHLRNAASDARAREQRARDFYEFACTLSAAPNVDSVLVAARNYFRLSHTAAADMLLPDLDNQLQIPTAKEIQVPGLDRNVARAVFSHADASDDRGQARGGIESGGLHYVPLAAPSRVRGVLVLKAAPDGPRGEALARDLATVAALIAIALERIHFLDVAHRATLAMHSERLRSTLLSALSHDLRTPITAILGSAETLRLGSSRIDPSQTALIEGIAAEARRTSALVENILDMARIESGELKLNREWNLLSEIADAAITERAALIGQRRIAVRIPDTLPLVECDALSIERVLVNLIENAARHTSADGHITVQAEANDKDVVVRVEDNGTGIEPGQENAIFGKFVRGSGAAGGLGLGLAISRAIVEAHGGHLSGTNNAWGGATFTFTLPQSPLAAPGPAMESE